MKIAVARWAFCTFGATGKVVGKIFPIFRHCAQWHDVAPVHSGSGKIGKIFTHRLAQKLHSGATWRHFLQFLQFRATVQKKMAPRRTVARRGAIVPDEKNAQWRDVYFALCNFSATGSGGSGGSGAFGATVPCDLFCFLTGGNKIEAVVFKNVW